MLRELHQELGIPDNYGNNGLRPHYKEATELVDVEPNIIGLMQRLTPKTAISWVKMKEAAKKDGKTLILVSGFRSIEYQANLIRKKIYAGQSVRKILSVNAAPGYSEHHTGRAIDVASPGSRPLTEEFELSDAYRWLTTNAIRFGFSMTYPRNNEQGFVFEPWHWTKSR
ncbi:MAG: hypothetical protein CMQ54_01140 [Gammaproteobacteria bacterium]|nr:hypothetical protein [Gammaproteobacteria bacterium]|tara:strand:- start:163 stop:669 length:507 start_codon:yes stop_codon:yes gene_type:complete